MLACSVQDFQELKFLSKMETMFAVGLKNDVKGVQPIYIPKPQIKKPKEVLVKIKQIGLDGTDFNMVKYDSKDIADNRNDIVLGHELLGIVEKTGKKVKTVKRTNFDEDFSDDDNNDTND